MRGRAIPFVLLAALPALCGQPLDPASKIDFAKALGVKEGFRGLAIQRLAATSAGLILAGGETSYEVRIARSDRNGSGMSSVAARLPGGVADSFAARPDGSFRVGTTRLGLEGHYDLYSPAGRYVSSFAILDPPDSIAASENEIVLVYANRLRAIHVDHGNAVVDREWAVSRPQVVFPFDAGCFAAINPASGEFMILDPRTPHTRVIATGLRSPDRRHAMPVTAAGGSIWFLVPGPFAGSRDAVQYSANRSILFRATLRIPADVKPRLIAISGRDVYIAGLGANVYRYELP